jgi:hypothetical protein
MVNYAPLPSPFSMEPLTLLDLFSGIGGFSYAAERLVGGFKTVAFCDSDEPCRKVLRKHWPDAPIFTDVRSLTAQDIQPLCPNGLSLITAGFPCQDLSVAGKQAGYDGKRSVLFYEIIRLARELRPKFLLLENVRNLLSHKDGETFQETLFQIAQAGYDAEWAVIPASDVGPAIVESASGLLPTPTTRDYKDSGPNVNYQKAADKGRLPGAIVVQCSAQNGGATYLSPCFVEEMMGYEVGWTDLSS